MSISAATGTKYTVWDGERICTDSAFGILKSIRDNADPDSELATMDVDEYARVLVEQSHLHIAPELMEYLQKQSCDSIYDRALAYLAADATSGVLILAMDVGK